MDQGLAILMLREAVLLIIKLSLPILVVALAVGVIISLLQALTQIQEQTLTFVPKMLAVFGLLVLLLPFMLGSLQDFAEDLFNLIMIKEAGVAL
ncbi:MAG: flagellar biosynthesis protein FliQ [Pseudomonadota bacterium]|jgi:flagellar biosynthetic protein FliQ|nr:flagellar biosynthesis protein FliQ [Alphaproteobacteria bacterium]